MATACGPTPRAPGRAGVVGDRWWTGTPKARTRCSRRCATRRTALVRRRGSAPGAGARGRGAARASCGRTWASGPTAGTVRDGPSSAPAYRFDIVSDYGAFRDLQRHRMLTIEWQDLDAGPRLRDARASSSEAGLADRFERSMARSAELYERSWRASVPPRRPMPWRWRSASATSMQMNAREAMHVVELRSGEQGHPAYRVVAQDMHRLIAERAGHRLIAEAMAFVDHDDPRARAPRRRAPRRGPPHAPPPDADGGAVVAAVSGQKRPRRLTRGDARSSWWARGRVA